MKTTVEISDDLLKRVKRIAADEGTTVRRLIEDGLRTSLAERRRRVPFRLRKASFAGNGLHTAIPAAGWSALREQIYKGRGE